MSHGGKASKQSCSKFLSQLPEMMDCNLYAVDNPLVEF